MSNITTIEPSNTMVAMIDKSFKLIFPKQQHNNNFRDMIFAFYPPAMILILSSTAIVKFAVIPRAIK